jgi:hypothetical protein
MGPDFRVQYAGRIRGFFGLVVIGGELECRRSGANVLVPDVDDWCFCSGWGNKLRTVSRRGWSRRKPSVDNARAARDTHSEVFHVRCNVSQRRRLKCSLGRQCQFYDRSRAIRIRNGFRHVLFRGSAHQTRFQGTHGATVSIYCWLGPSAECDLMTDSFIGIRFSLGVPSNSRVDFKLVTEHGGCLAGTFP